MVNCFMKMDKLFFVLTILLQLQTVLNGKTKFSDRQVATMMPKYFARDHNAPQITKTRESVVTTLNK